MTFYDKFPYTNFQELNLDWLINALQELKTEVENYIEINSIEYADPLLWNITTQYEKNTVVITEAGNAYLSVQAVPSGVNITNTDYWTEIGNFSALWQDIKDAISVRNEGYSTTASAPRALHDLVWISNNLYEVTQAMNAGDAYVVGSNCQHIDVSDFVNAIRQQITVNTNAISAEAETRAAQIAAETQNREQAITELSDSVTDQISNEANAREAADIAINEDIINIYNTIEEIQSDNTFNVKNYGAVGDGVTDDTVAFKDTITAAGTNASIFIPEGTYCISDTITLPFGTRITGAGEYVTKIKATAQDITVFYSTNQRIEISELSIIGDNKAQFGIRITDAWANIHNVWIESTTSHAIHLSQDNHILTNIHTERSCRGGICLHDHNVNNIISNCEIWATDVCIRIDEPTTHGMEGLQLSNCVLAWANKCIDVYSPFLQFNIVNCILDQYESAGIVLHSTALGSTGLMINNCYLGSRANEAESPNSMGLVVNGGVHCIRINNSFFHLNHQKDIHMIMGNNNNNQDVTITGCTFDKGFNIQQTVGLFMFGNTLLTQVSGDAYNITNGCTGAAVYNRAIGSINTSGSSVALVGNITS